MPTLISSLRSWYPLAVLTVIGAAVPWSTSSSDVAPCPRAFPDAWIGHWKGTGTVRSMRKRGEPLEFAMELRVAPIESGGEHAKPRWTWEIVYGTGQKRQVRRYELVAQDAAAGHYVIDEKNSILIDAWRVDDKKGTGLRSRFRVGKNQIDSVYRLVGDRLEVELVTYGTEPKQSSGGEASVPEVDSYGLRAVQTASMRRR